MGPLKYDVHGRLLNDTLLWRKIGVKTIRVRFFGEITGFRFTQFLYAVTASKALHPDWDPISRKRFRIATALRYRWCLPSRNACRLVRTCVLRVEELPRFLLVPFSFFLSRRLPLTPSVIHKSVAVLAEPRRDLLGDSIQPCVIDVISSPGVTVAQLARAPNVCPELPALPETLVYGTTTGLALHLPPIYLEDNEKLKSLYFLRIFTHSYRLTTSLRGKICVRKIGKAIEAYRAAPLDSVHRTGSRDTGSCGRQTKPGTFQTGRPNKPAKKCNGKLKSERGNLHRSARILVEITGILVDTIFLIKSTRILIFTRIIISIRIMGYPSGESVPVYVTIATTRDHANEYFPTRGIHTDRGVKRTERSDGPADRAASTKYVSVDAEPAVRSADPLEAVESPERVVYDHV
ncbi:hypothetical protein ALC57_14037 [Trachymyrmex cornetzi]|uniref:Uncharacterized protein n=1 Tax=Trachymyrmex cornetzi TaxID=471704 RepID=A0A151IYW3_9HYME|nr:hypothetical protein ALC57_14037 [Trachymyrmex cornetzi]